MVLNVSKPPLILLLLDIGSFILDAVLGWCNTAAVIILVACVYRWLWQRMAGAQVAVDEMFPDGPGSYMDVDDFQNKDVSTTWAITRTDPVWLWLFAVVNFKHMWGAVTVQSM